MGRGLIGALPGGLASGYWVVGKDLGNVSLGVVIEARDQGRHLLLSLPRRSREAGALR